MPSSPQPANVTSPETAAPAAPVRKAWRRRPIRVAIGCCRMAGELTIAVVSHFFMCGFKSAADKPAARNRWMQFCATRFLGIFGIKVGTHGQKPLSGILVCNHLSYLDIIVLGSLGPSVFVSKREVRHWPVFGWLTRNAGTVYVDRERRTHVGKVTDEIQEALDRGALVILFPEGTSSDGSTVLPLKSALLEPAADDKRPLSVGLIEYHIDKGSVANEVCYWADMTFFPHLLNATAIGKIRATVTFAPVKRESTDRKELARQLQAELLRLKNAS